MVGKSEENREVKLSKLNNQDPFLGQDFILTKKKNESGIKMSLDNDDINEREGLD